MQNLQNEYGLIPIQADVQSLQNKLQAAEAELTMSVQKTMNLQQQLEEERKKFVEDKQTLEATIVDMSTSAITSQADEVERADFIKLQEERVTVCWYFFMVVWSPLQCFGPQLAEERYQRELIAHAEAIKTVEVLKVQLAAAETLAREKQTAADTAQSILTTSEASWKSQKDIIDKEMADINARYPNFPNFTMGFLILAYISDIKS